LAGSSVCAAGLERLGFAAAAKATPALIAHMAVCAAGQERPWLANGGWRSAPPLD